MKRIPERLIESCIKCPGLYTCSLVHDPIPINCPLDDAPEKSVEIREPVKWFAEQMELTLRKHDDRSGWDNCLIEWLTGRLICETSELILDTVNNHSVATLIKDCTNIANFAMIIADNLRTTLPEKRNESKPSRGKSVESFWNRRLKVPEESK